MIISIHLCMVHTYFRTVT